MRVCLGGTFDRFHVGHEAMLQRAAEVGDEVFVGVTTGPLAKREDRDVAPWDERARAVQAFFDRRGYMGALKVRALEDPDGPAAREDFDAIIVSPETRKGAQRINAVRRKAGRKPLEAIMVPHVLAQDLMPVSATRIAAGAIDRDGRRLEALRVAVGSGNPVKVHAVGEELERVVPDLRCIVREFPVASGVAEQPREEETVGGARHRAREALAAWRGADYGVGVEAGLVHLPGDDAPVDIQACVVIDSLGHETVGWGPGFHYPAWVRERALAGEMVSDILGPVAGDDEIGSTTGAIGYLTDGRMDRTALTRTAVLMAFLPRFRRSLYAARP